MNKAKNNALDALRALIAERQQYEQWIATLESKRDGTPEPVFTRVYSDYRGRIDRVLGEIRTHSTELQENITTLSTQLGEVVRDEQTRRETMQEAELRALVGEYAADQWEKIREDSERELQRIAVDRTSLEEQLAELRGIQKLSDTGTSGSTDELPQPVPVLQPAQAIPEGPREIVPEAIETRESESRAATAPIPDRKSERSPDRSTERTPEPAFAAAPTPGEAQVALRSAAEPAAQAMARSAGGAQGFPTKRSTPTRPEQSKTLKCPECGTANYPTEWYCEKCGGELATM